MHEVFDVLACIIGGMFGRAALRAAGKVRDQGMTIRLNAFYAVAAIIQLPQELCYAAFPRRRIGVAARRPRRGFRRLVKRDGKGSMIFLHLYPRFIFLIVILTDTHRSEEK